MKILYYSPNPVLNLMSPSGPGTHMREMICSFKKLGHEVNPLIVGGTHLDSEDLKSPQPIAVQKKIKKFIPSILWETLKDYRLLKKGKLNEKELEKRVNDFNPDLIYERAAYLQNSGIKIAAKYKIKHILEINAPLTQERILLEGHTFYENISNNIEARLINSAYKIVVVSSELKKYFVEKCNIDPDKFIVTPNAINLNKINIEEKTVEELKINYSLQNNLVIGFVGSIFKYHGVDILIEAFAKILMKFNNVKLLIIGDGEVLPKLKEMADDLNITKNVIFTGNLPYDDVFNHIDLFDIAVLAKTKEYMSPIKIFEYGAMKKAIIAPRLSAINDVMTDMKNGILINSNVEELINALEMLIKKEDLRKKIALSFHEKVLDFHTWDKMAAKILSSVNIK